jgi:hypothetical protein
VQEIRLEDSYAVLGYTSAEKIRRLVARSGRRLRIADERSAYLPLANGLAEPAGPFGEVKTLLRPDAGGA